MRRHTTKQPRGPAARATPIPAASARRTKSSILRRPPRRRVVADDQRRLADHVMRMVVMMRVDGDGVRRVAEKRAIGGMARHRLGMAAAADMMIEADDAV